MSLNSVDILQHLSIEVEPGVVYCYDDSYIVDAQMIERNPFILTRLERPVFVREMTTQVANYNRMSLSSNPILVKEGFDQSNIRSDVWKIPESFKQLSYDDIIDKLVDVQTARGITDDANLTRTKRIVTEMRAYEKANNLDMIRLMMYIISTLEQHKQIWGVGRGSSVSSYVLFLIGVHDIDSVEYDLDFTDFMKPQ